MFRTLMTGAALAALMAGSAAAQQSFSDIDTSGDGVLDAAEFTSAFGAGTEDRFAS